MPKYAFTARRYMHNCNYDCPCYDRTFGKCGINNKKLDYVPANGGYTPTPDWCPLEMLDDSNERERAEKMQRRLAAEEAAKAIAHARSLGVSDGDIIAAVDGM